jgi:hypothetical protein
VKIILIYFRFCGPHLITILKLYKAYSGALTEVFANDKQLLTTFHIHLLKAFLGDFWGTCRLSCLDENALLIRALRPNS